jgi:hypothetical protein
MIAVILQLAAITLGLWFGFAMGSWTVGFGAAAFLWLLVIYSVGIVRLIVGPHTAEARRFGEIRSTGNDREGKD